MDLKKLAPLVAGLTLESVSATEEGGLALQFTNGSALVVQRVGDGIAATFQDAGGQPSTGRPSPRQREYLEFIKRYMARFGVAPAESDIQRHFLVSAPSVNQMIRTLERRGFITRDRDLFTGQAIPRSIRVIDEA